MGGILQDSFGGVTELMMRTYEKTTDIKTANPGETPGTVRFEALPSHGLEEYGDMWTSEDI